MHISEFDYHLPDELIAQEPLADRGASRMMVVDRSNGEIADRSFTDLAEKALPGRGLTRTVACPTGRDANG